MCYWIKSGPALLHITQQTMLSWGDIWSSCKFDPELISGAALLLNTKQTMCILSWFWSSSVIWHKANNVILRWCLDQLCYLIQSRQCDLDMMSGPALLPGPKQTMWSWDGVWTSSATYLAQRRPRQGDLIGGPEMDYQDNWLKCLDRKRLSGMVIPLLAHNNSLL